MENSFISDMAEQEVAASQTGLSFELNNLIDIDKATIKEKVNAVVTTIQEGWTDPVDALILAKKGTEFFTALEKNVRPFAEAKSVGKDFVKHGTKITEAMNGVKYDYSSCGDLEYEELKFKAEKASKDLKAREDFLKAITKPIELVDTNTGETYTVNAPVKSGKLGFKLEME